MAEQWSPPSWLVEVLAETPPRPVSPAAAADIGPGSLYIVAPMDGAGERRVGVVLEVGLGWVEVALLHTEPDIATDEDVTVGPDRSPTGYPLVLQFDITGPVFFAQLESYLGSIELGVARTAAEGAVALDAPRGVAIRSREDPRRSRKLDELRSLQSLSRSCAGQVIDGPQEDDFDPELLLAAYRGSEDALRFFIDASEKRQRRVSVVAETLIGEGALSAGDGDAYALDLLNVLRSGLSGAERRNRRHQTLRWRQSLHASPAGERALAAVAVNAATSGTPCVYLASGREYWPGPVVSGTVGLLTAEVGQRRVQIVGLFHEPRQPRRRRVAA